MNVQGLGDGLRLSAGFAYTSIFSGQLNYDFFDPSALFEDNSGAEVDRSLDLKGQLWTSPNWIPSLAAGLQDGFGTSDNQAAYLVATSRLGPVDVSLGLGSSDLAGEFATDLGDLGQVAPFGGLRWNTGFEGLNASLEWSPEDLSRSAYQEAIIPTTRFNFGLGLEREWGRVDLGYLWGQQFQIGVQTWLDLNKPLAVETPSVELNVQALSQIDEADRKLQSLALLGDSPALDDAVFARNQQSLRTIDLNLAQQGFGLVSINVFEPDGLRLVVQNNTYISQAQALKRVLRILDFTAPSLIRRFAVTFTKAEVPLSHFAVERDELSAGFLQEALPETLFQPQADLGRQVYKPNHNPSPFEWGLRPAFTPIVGYNNQFASAQISAQLDLAYYLRPSLKLQGQVGLNVWNNFEALEPRSNSQLAPVRSEQALYLKGRSTLFAPSVKLQGFKGLTDKVFIAGQAGYLESGYAGFGAELLYVPKSTSAFAIGLDSAYVLQRVPGKISDWLPEFGLKDYRTWTGHVSLYSRIPDVGFAGLKAMDARLSAGRYLAQDWGTSLEVGKTFASGVRVAGFATLTDAGFEAFGEGNFDKGVRLTVPLSAWTGRASSKQRNLTWRPIQGDGGARVAGNSVLYDLYKNQSAYAIEQGWKL